MMMFYHAYTFSTDFDECLAETHNCSDNAHCSNTVGSYTCECMAGYEGDGFNCTGIYILSSATRVNLLVVNQQQAKI